ncbi:hypothetical protein [Streptomyces sp. NPDC007205]|uniref:hypothetical protein n=1 Tax=Streptomyces sp. NPDC007205 TaxID=3154316 RepID=UPI00341081FC
MNPYRSLLRTPGSLRAEVLALLAVTSVLGTPTALWSATGHSLPGFVMGCVITGATALPVGAGMRALWAKADIAEHLRGPANSLESVGMEVVFVLGPPLVGLLAAPANGPPRRCPGRLSSLHRRPCVVEQLCSGKLRHGGRSRPLIIRHHSRRL